MIAGLEVTATSSASRPSIRDVHKAATFDLLLTSAWELFAEQGYDRTTVEQIASRAGASRATFYLHFDKKWSPLAELLEARIVPETLTYYERLESYGTPNRDQLHAWLDDALTFYETHRVDLEIIQSASMVEPELAARGNAITHRCADVLTTYLEAWGPEREAEARTRVRLLILQLSQFATLLAQGREEVDRQTALRVLLDFWTAGLAAPSQVQDNQ